MMEKNWAVNLLHALCHFCYITRHLSTQYSDPAEFCDLIGQKVLTVIRLLLYVSVYILTTRLQPDVLHNPRMIKKKKLKVQYVNMWLLKLVMQHQQFRLPWLLCLSFQCLRLDLLIKYMKRGVRPLEVCPFWAIVAAQHGGSLEVDPLLMYI